MSTTFAPCDACPIPDVCGLLLTCSREGRGRGPFDPAALGHVCRARAPLPGSVRDQLGASTPGGLDWFLAGGECARCGLGWRGLSATGMLCAPRDPYTMEHRLCDDAGLVSHELTPSNPIAPGLTYLQQLNNLRRRGGDDAYAGPPFSCSGSAYLAGHHIQCTSSAHVQRVEALARADAPAATVSLELRLLTPFDRARLAAELDPRTARARALREEARALEAEAFLSAGMCAKCGELAPCGCAR